MRFVWCPIPESPAAWLLGWIQAPLLGLSGAPSKRLFYAQRVKNHVGLALILLLLPAPRAIAQRVTWSPQRLESGSPVLFRVDLDSAAGGVHGNWLNHAVTFSPSANGRAWYALAGIDVEQSPGKYVLDITVDAQAGQPLHIRRELTVLPGQYKTTTLHVAEKFVAPDAKTLKLIAADKAVKDEAFAHQANEPLWRGDFRSPVPFAPTDSFGTRRMFNGELASVHRGTDFHARPGTPVLAANDGQVIVAQGMFYEGNLVVIDHGQQFSTLYMHLSRIEVKAGERVRKGQRLGLSGATGRVTGPHLHFAARWQGDYVDPVLLLKLALPAMD
jgi:murein DD-endopeptidase MepM/ murein hydrolase activator NlpD